MKHVAQPVVSNVSGRAEIQVSSRPTCTTRVKFSNVWKEHNHVCECEAHYEEFSPESDPKFPGDTTVPMSFALFKRLCTYRIHIRGPKSLSKPTFAIYFPFQKSIRESLSFRMQITFIHSETYLRPTGTSSMSHSCNHLPWLEQAACGSACASAPAHSSLFGSHRFLATLSEGPSSCQSTIHTQACPLIGFPSVLCSLVQEAVY